jgi:hypothetical protein
MTKQFFEKFSPASIGKNLWGAGKMPLRWKLLFAAQSCIFVSAMFMRQVDVANAQKRKLELAEESREEGMGGETTVIEVATSISKEADR